MSLDGLIKPLHGQDVNQPCFGDDDVVSQALSLDNLAQDVCEETFPVRI